MSGIMEELKEVHEEVDSSLNTENPKGWIDALLGRLISRKMTVWIVSTVCFFLTMLTADQWMYITLIYLGVQGTLDFFKKG